jgi:hypothetical protein
MRRAPGGLPMSLSAVPPVLRVVRLDPHDPRDGAALVQLLDEYARSPTGGGTALTDAVKAVKEGAYNYLEKPISEGVYVIWWEEVAIVAIVHQMR